MIRQDFYLVIKRNCNNTFTLAYQIVYVYMPGNWIKITDYPFIHMIKCNSIKWHGPKVYFTLKKNKWLSSVQSINITMRTELCVQNLGEDRVREQNLRKNGQQQRPELEKNNVPILDELLKLRNCILDLQELLHCIHGSRCYYLKSIHRSSLVTKSCDYHEDRKKSNHHCKSVA